MAFNKSFPDEAGPPFSSITARLVGMQSLFQSHPRMLLNALVRVVIATILAVNLDAFLKLVVTPVLIASVIGIIAAPLTFVLGNAIQSVIYSFCFFGFDDKFLLTTLDATGGKERLLLISSDGEWHKMGKFEKLSARLAMKFAAGFSVGFAGLATMIPIVGPILTAGLSGWVVAWDMVYVPLSGIGYVGVFPQARSVYDNFRQFYWFGFWAVLAEEIPILGPICHVYNVYSAAFFLENVYLNNKPVSVDGSINKKKL